MKCYLFIRIVVVVSWNNKGTQRFCKKTNNFISVLDEDIEDHTKNGYEMSCTYRVPAHRAKYDFVFNLFQHFVLRKIYFTETLFTCAAILSKSRRP